MELGKAIAGIADCGNCDMQVRVVSIKRAPKMPSSILIANNNTQFKFMPLNYALCEFISLFTKYVAETDQLNS